VKCKYSGREEEEYVWGEGEKDREVTGNKVSSCKSRFRACDDCAGIGVACGDRRHQVPSRQSARVIRRTAQQWYVLRIVSVVALVFSHLLFMIRATCFCHYDSDSRIK
jgi:hypothetical protein